MSYLLNKKIRAVDELLTSELHEDAQYDLDNFVKTVQKVNNETKFAKRANLHFFRFYFKSKGKTESSIKSILNHYENDKAFHSELLDLNKRFYSAIAIIEKMKSLSKQASDEEYSNHVKLVKYSRIGLEIQTSITDMSLDLSEKIKRIRSSLREVDSIEDMLSYLSEAIKQLTSIDLSSHVTDMTPSAALALKSFVRELRKVSQFDQKHLAEITQLVSEIKKRLRPDNPYNVFLYDDQFVKDMLLFSETVRLAYSSDMDFINMTLKPQMKEYLIDLISVAREKNMLSSLSNLQALLDRFVVGKFVNINTLMNMLPSDRHFSDENRKYYEYILASITEKESLRDIFFCSDFASNPIYELANETITRFQNNLLANGIDWNTSYITETYNILRDLVDSN